MGQSLVKNYIHIVFSTKYRQPLIQPQFEQNLYSYIGGTCKELECYPVKIGGYVDHIHILCMLSKKLPLMKLVQDIKSSSSKWMKEQDPSLANFYWQNGYGAFSVNYKDIKTVSNYIENQHAHHAGVDFQNELRFILNKQEIEFDERYVWD
jgi:putative transposase